MAEETKIYKVAPERVVSHSKDGKDYQAGEVIPLDHLGVLEVERLVNMGVIIEVKPEDKKEVKHGKANVNKTDIGG